MNVPCTARDDDCQNLASETPNLRAQLSAPIQSFARELCEAIAHRWQPERVFVVLTLTTFLDESGTHDRSPVTVMAGIMGTAYQWEQFEAGFDRLRDHYGFRVFHTKKFKKRTGDFRGWHPLRQLALMHDLALLTGTDSAFVDSVTVTLDNEDYKANYITRDKPRKLRLESKYGLCFRNCLMYFVLQAIKFAENEAAPPKLHFVLESGHPNANEAVHIFNEMKQEIRTYGLDMLGEVTLADKDDRTPLMMADFLAHTAFMMGRDNKPVPNEVPFSERASQPPLPPGEGGVTHLRFAPGGLADLKGALIERLKARNGPAKRPASGEQSS